MQVFNQTFHNFYILLVDFRIYLKFIYCIRDFVLVFVFERLSA